MRYGMKGDKGNYRVFAQRLAYSFIFYWFECLLSIHSYANILNGYWAKMEKMEINRGEGEAMMMAGSHWETRWVSLLDMSK